MFKDMILSAYSSFRTSNLMKSKSSMMFAGITTAIKSCSEQRAEKFIKLLPLSLNKLITLRATRFSCNTVLGLFEWWRSKWKNSRKRNNKRKNKLDRKEWLSFVARLSKKQNKSKKSGSLPQSLQSNISKCLGSKIATKRSTVSLYWALMGLIMDFYTSANSKNKGLSKQ